MGRNKDAAVDFLGLIIAGKFDEAYSRYVDMEGRHHNAHTPAGFPALKQGMKDNDAMFPDKRFELKKVAEDGDQVVTYSRLILKPGELELGVVHWFRFRDGKITELWDLAQPATEDAVNHDGMF
jgi:predicted SnoaL-like aldol condensation-catalyzing enzyme